MLAAPRRDGVGFLSDRKLEGAARETRAGACFVTEREAGLLPARLRRAGHAVAPQAAWAAAALRLHRPKRLDPSSPLVHPEAMLEDDASVGQGAVIGAGAQIGEGTEIGPHAVIGPGVTIGRGCQIGAGASISCALIGDGVKISASVVIGEAGFGVAAGPRGLIDIPQLGRVILQDNVSVGAHTCIDRGAFDDTVIGENTKIDNLVQIAHNVTVGRNCVITGHCGLSGSCSDRRRRADGRPRRAGRSRRDRRRRASGGGGRRDARRACRRILVRHSSPAGKAVLPRGGLAHQGRGAKGQGRGGMRKAPTEILSPSDIGIEEVMRRIPHRPPFLLIDRAEEYRAHQSIVGIKMVTINEPFFVGHFPGRPVMPGVLIIEAIAQTGGVLMSKSMDVDVENKGIMFISVDNCRFRHPVRPGDVLRMPVEVMRARGDVFKFKGQGMVGDKVAAECEFAAMLVET